VDGNQASKLACRVKYEFYQLRIIGEKQDIPQQPLDGLNWIDWLDFVL
jgi:hypothetical protein